MKDRTEGRRVRGMTEREITRAARADPDANILPARFWRNAMVLVPGGKKQVTLRLDNDVLDFFKRGGRGYQTRINRVLRAFVQAQRQTA